MSSWALLGGEVHYKGSGRVSVGSRKHFKQFQRISRRLLWHHIGVFGSFGGSQLLYREFEGISEAFNELSEAIQKRFREVQMCYREFEVVSGGLQFLTFSQLQENFVEICLIGVAFVQRVVDKMFSTDRYLFHVHPFLQSTQITFFSQAD